MSHSISGGSSLYLRRQADNLEGEVRRSLTQRQSAEREAILNGLQRALEEQPNVLFAYVHGSFLENRPFQGVDLAVYLDQVDEQAMTA